MFGRLGIALATLFTVFAFAVAPASAATGSTIMTQGTWTSCGIGDLPGQFPMR